MSWSKSRPHWYKWIQPMTEWIDKNDESKGTQRVMIKVEKKAYNTYYLALHALSIHYENMCSADVVRVVIPKVNAIVEARVSNIKAHNVVMQWGKEVKAYYPCSLWTRIGDTPEDWAEQLKLIKKPIKKFKRKNWGIYDNI